MSSRIDKGITAVGVPGSLFFWRNRDASEITSVESDLGPGTMVASVTAGTAPQGKPAVLGGQDTNLRLAVTKTGSPGVGTNAGRLAYQVEGAAHWKGYTAANIQSGWDLLGIGSTDKYVDTARISKTGEVVFVVAVVSGIVEQSLRCHVWTPSTNSWAAYSIRAAPPTGYDYGDVAVTTLPGDRLICIVSMHKPGVDVLYEVHQSINSGQSWSRYEENAITIDEDAPISGTERGMMAWDGTNVCWIRQYVQQSTGNMRIFQYASVDLGATYREVREWVTIASTLPADLNLLALPDRRMMLIYRTAGALLKFRVSLTWRPFEDAVEQSIPLPAQVQAVAAHVDEEGTIHIYAEVFSFSHTGRVMHLSSPNGGRTWTTPYVCWNTSSGLDYPERMVSVSGMGQQFLGMQHVADVGALDKHFGVVRFGGWSEPEEVDLQIPGSGTLANHVLLFNPYELPYDMGTHWTRVGAGGTWALDAGGTKNGATTLTTTGAADSVSHSYGAAFVDYFVALKGEVISGGGLGFGDLALQLVSGDGATRYFAAISFSQTATAFRVIYNELGNVATVDTAWDFSVLGRVHIRASMDSANALLDVWYKDTASFDWSRVAGAPFALVTAVVATGSSVLFGSTLGTAGVSEWEIGQVGVGTLGKIAINAGVGQLKGKEISSPYGFPIPGIGPDTLISRLHNLAGPLIVGEFYDIDAVSARPISSAFTDVTPKRTSVGRTADTSEAVVVAWDVGQGTAYESMYVYVDGNVRSLVLEGFDGIWNEVVTYDPAVDFTNVAFNREGDSIKARVSGTSGNRPLFESELDEGWVDLGSGKLRKIRSNRGGEWTTGPHADIAKARIYLDGIDGTESTASNCSIFSPRGVAIAHGVATNYTKYRVILPDGPNPWGYHELRYLSVGYLSTAGKHHARTWSWSRERNATTRTDASQSRYVVRTGRAARFFTMSWPRGTDMTQMYNGNAEVIKADTGDPLAVRGNVGWWAMGLVEELDSGAKMCVFLPHVPEAGGTVTNPELFAFGHFDSNVEISNALGEHAVNTLLRVTGMSLREGV